MKVRNSLRSLKNRHRDCRVVRRKGRVYVINKPNSSRAGGMWGMSTGPNPYLVVSCLRPPKRSITIAQK